jgi:hypothetical protein
MGWGWHCGFDLGQCISQSLANVSSQKQQARSTVLTLLHLPDGPVRLEATEINLGVT